MRAKMARIVYTLKKDVKRCNFTVDFYKITLTVRYCCVKISELSAGVVQWQNPSLPSWSCGFDSHHPLHFFAQCFALVAQVDRATAF